MITEAEKGLRLRLYLNPALRQKCSFSHSFSMRPLERKVLRPEQLFGRLFGSPLHAAAASHVLWQFNLTTKTANTTTLRHAVSPVILIKLRSPAAQPLHSDVGFCCSAGFGMSTNTLPKADTSVRRISLP